MPRAEMNCATPDTEQPMRRFRSITRFDSGQCVIPSVTVLAYRYANLQAQRASGRWVRVCVRECVCGMCMCMCMCTCICMREPVGGRCVSGSARAAACTPRICAKAYACTQTQCMHTQCMHTHGVLECAEEVLWRLVVVGEGLDEAAELVRLERLLQTRVPARSADVLPVGLRVCVRACACVGAHARHSNADKAGRQRHDRREHRTRTSRENNPEARRKRERENKLRVHACRVHCGVRGVPVRSCARSRACCRATRRPARRWSRSARTRVHSPSRPQRKCCCSTSNQTRHAADSPCSFSNSNIRPRAVNQTRSARRAQAKETPRRSG